MRDHFYVGFIDIQSLAPGSPGRPRGFETDIGRVTVTQEDGLLVIRRYVRNQLADTYKIPFERKSPRAEIEDLLSPVANLETAKTAAYNTDYRWMGNKLRNFTRLDW